MDRSQITFKELPIPIHYGKVIYRIFYAVERGRSPVMEMFQNLEASVKDDIKDLICRMATVNNLKSPKINYHLKGYDSEKFDRCPIGSFSFNNAGRISSFSNICSKRESPFMIASITN